MHRVLSVDLAIQRYRDIGIVVMESSAKYVATSLVRPESLGLRERPRVPLLAQFLDDLAQELGVRAILIDGPQAWKSPNNGLEHSRICERLLFTQAKTGLIGNAKPGTAIGFVSFAIALFDELGLRGWSRLDGRTAQVADGQVALESFPTAAWRALGQRPLPAKSAARETGIADWVSLLRAGYRVEFAESPTHDELQAAVAGLGGLAWLAGNDSGYELVGHPPEKVNGHWCEGYILNPRPGIARAAV
jgi:hypothetical protein